MLSETVISVTYVTRVSGVRHKSHISQNVTREAEGPNERTRVVSLPPRTAHACRERETPIEGVWRARARAERDSQTPY